MVLSLGGLFQLGIGLFLASYGVVIADRGWRSLYPEFQDKVIGMSLIIIGMLVMLFSQV